MKARFLYFDWLQKDNPVGRVERLPRLSNRFETGPLGLYCIGDLTGVPLIKLAAESGHDIMERLQADQAFQRRRSANADPVRYDLVIVGAGPAGMSAAIRSRQLGYRALVLEAVRPFKTIHDFPAAKPIIVTPTDTAWRSSLKFSDGTKESLIAELEQATASVDLPVRSGEAVESVTADADGFVAKTSQAEYKALAVIIAVGKAGSPRKLGVAGEDLPFVAHRLIDPTIHAGEKVLVVGGGNSAVEAAVALAQSGASLVTLSYRGKDLARPALHNLMALRDQVDAGRVAVLTGSTVERFETGAAQLHTGRGDLRLSIDAAYVLAGRELPSALLKRCGISMLGERQPGDRLKTAAALLFAAMLFFGKKAPMGLQAGMPAMGWPAAYAMLAAVSFVGLAAVLVMLLTEVRLTRSQGLWPLVKRSWLGLLVGLFSAAFISRNVMGVPLLGWDTGEWYSAAYSATVLLFGLRRMHVRPTPYIRRQTWALMLIQVVPLFILPVFVFPWLGEHGMLSAWAMENVFPGGSYWRSYGFILAWPLFMANLASGQPTAFWLALSLLQTFVIIPWLVWRWGKGAYCGWICSCGALAETLGDEYREKAPHGLAAKRLENMGQVVLWAAVVVTLLSLVLAQSGELPGLAANLHSGYEAVVDIVLSGVLGVGLYFVLSGRTWCRFFCPLAALMHIYARFSVYRIFADKKRCISCGICTRVCHMGIDVMSYASRGKPMDDVECVRCSACVVDCPMDVLSFGRARGGKGGRT